MIITNVTGNYFLKENDTATEIRLRIEDSEGNPVELSTAPRIEVVIGNAQGRILTKTPKVMTTTGELEFGLDEGDSLPVGDNNLEVHIYTDAGERHVAPSKGYYRLRVQKAIDSNTVEITTYSLTYFIDEVNRITAGLPELVVQANEVAERLDGLSQESVDLLAQSTTALAQSQESRDLAAEALVDAAQAGANAIAAEQAATRANDAADRATPAAIRAEGAAEAAEQAKIDADAATAAANLATEAANVTVTDLIGYNRPIDPFNISTAYLKNQAARFNGSTFRARENTQGNPLPVAPAVSNTWWNLEAQRGVDGSGAVSAVSGVLPGIDGDVILTPQDIGALGPEHLVDPIIRHVEVVNTPVTDYNGRGVIFQQVGATPDTPARPTYDELLKDVGKTEAKFKPRVISPTVVFSFDDNTIKDYTDIYPLLRNKGVNGTMAVIANRVGTNGFCNQSQILEMKSYGIEIASHGLTHTTPFPNKNDEDLDAELRVSKEILNNYGFDVKNVLVPFGPTDERVMRECAKYYRSARVSGAGTTGDFNTTPINTFRLNSILLGDTPGTSNGIDPISGFMVDTLNHWKYWVDQAISRKLLIIFISHADVIVANNRLSDLAALIDYVKSKTEVSIKTLDQALDSFENYVDAQDLKIGADGKLTGKYGKLKSDLNDSVLNDTPLNAIDPLAITMNVVTAGNRTGFPTSRTGGTLLSVKPDNNANRTFQLYKPFGKAAGLYFRDYDADGASKWEELKDVYVWATGTLPSTHSAATLIENKINFYSVNQANAAGYPENLAGTLIGYRLDGEFSSITESYKLRNSSKTYTRYWDTVLARWSDWTQQLNVVQLNSGDYSSTTPISDFPVGISYKQIFQGGASLLPESTAGLLETHNILYNGYKYQLYHILNTTKTYRRVFKSDATWTAWVKYSD